MDRPTGLNSNKSVYTAGQLNSIMVDNSPNLSIMFDSSFRILCCNSATLCRFGFSDREEFTDLFMTFITNSIPLTQPSGRKSIPFEQRFEIAVKEGSHEFFTKLIINGEPAFFNVLFRRVTIGDTFVVVAYLTERTDFDERLRLMLDYTPLACVVLDEKTFSAVDCNAEAINLFGFSSKESLCEKLSEIIPQRQPDGMPTRQLLREKINEAHETGRSEFSCVLMRTTRERIPADLTLVRLNWKTSFSICMYARDLRALRETEDKLYHYSSLLQAVNDVATVLNEADAETYTHNIYKSLKIIGRTAGVDRAYLWENFTIDGTLYCRQIFEWSEGAEPQQGKEFTLAFNYDDIPLWRNAILNNRSINGPVKNLEKSERAILEIQGIKSILMLPIHFRGQPWGFIGFDDCRTERTFSKSKEYVLQACGVLITSSFERSKMTAELIETSNELQSHDRLLRSVNDVASLLLESEQDDFNLVVLRALMTLGKCVNSSCVAIWRNYTNEDDRLLSAARCAWIEGRSVNGSFGVIDYVCDLPEWLHSRNDIISPISSYKRFANINELPSNCKSMHLLPLNIHGSFWGFISFFHSEAESVFNPKEIGILRSGGIVIGSAIIRNEITENLVEAREKALLSAKSKSEFLSRMSHEIRTPMNAIIGMTELAKKSGDMAKIKHYLGTVDASSRQLLEIINDVLDMSKIDANKLEITNREFDFEGMLWHVFSVTQVKMDEKKINLQFDFPNRFKRKIISDELRLSQVLINLLSNAVKFSPDYSKIVLRAGEIPIDENHSRLVIAVKDNGIGIQPDRLGSVFQSFEQADGSITRDFGGTGLGLSISKRIIDLMGGDIKVESEPGSGSKFTVELDIEWGSQCDTYAIEAGLNKDLRILIVDDAPDSIEYLKNNLNSLSLSCDTAGSGSEAINLVSKGLQTQKPYDVIFLDWYMPGISGAETAAEIKRIIDDDVIVIMISSGSRDEIEREAAAIGIQYFLSKPVLPSDLYNILIKLTGQPIPSNEETQSNSEYNWEGKRILLAEDNEINREIVAGILEDTFVTIEFAENGREAVEIFFSAPDGFDVILMDVQMPILDGLSATQKIRSSGIPGADKIPIIAMTANAFKEDKETSFKAGMNGHIAKPFDVQEVFKTLNKYLGSRN